MRKSQKAAEAAKAAEAKKSVRTKAKPGVAIWEELGLHCSSNERRADEASRDVEAWLKCYFMRDKLGEEFGGSVSGVASFGIFVTLDSLFVEGMVHVSELGSDFFQYDEVRNELRGERTGQRYGLTDRVRIQVGRVDLDARKMDFRLITDATDRAAAPGAGKPGAGKSGKPSKKAAPAPTAEVKAVRQARDGARSGRGGGGAKPAPVAAALPVAASAGAGAGGKSGQRGGQGAEKGDAPSRRSRSRKKRG